MDGTQVTQDPGNFAPRDELNAVAPMRADVSDRSGFTAEAGYQSPIPICVEVQPILGIRAIGMENFAELTPGNHIFGFLNQRIVPIIEIDCVYEA